MPFTISKTERIALIGRGIPYFIYNLLTTDGFNCVGHLSVEPLFSKEGLLNSSRPSKNSVKLIKSPVMRRAFDASLKDVDVILVDISMREITSPSFKHMIERQLLVHRDLKAVFFPRIDLPSQLGIQNLENIFLKINSSLEAIQKILKFKKKYSRVDFFPIHQLVFYLGFRSQVENGKNQSLELIQMAKDLFKRSYLAIVDSQRPGFRLSDKILSPKHIDFIGDSQIMNLLDGIKLNPNSNVLLMNGSEWDAQNFSFSPTLISLTPKFTKPLSIKTSMIMPSCGERVLITNIGTQSHCLYERLMDALKINGVSEESPRYYCLIREAIMHYRRRHFELIAHLRERYTSVVVVSDPPFQHFRIDEDGRKYEGIFKLIDNILKDSFEEAGCLFLNLRDIVGRSGRAYDFLSNKTLSPLSEEIDWVHGNREFYEFMWRKTTELLENLQNSKEYQ